jgi:hypothetical protein
MNPRDRTHTRHLRVLPQPRGGWIVVCDQETVGAEYVTATEAERAALAGLREGDELVVTIAITAAIGAADQARASATPVRAGPCAPRRTSLVDAGALQMGRRPHFGGPG